MISLIIYRLVMLPSIIILSFLNAFITVIKWMKHGQIPNRKVIQNTKNKKNYGSKKR